VFGIKTFIYFIVFYLFFLLLQVTVELVSDSKDFATALAKMQLAEMGHVEMVSIPQQLKQPKSQAVLTAKSAATNASVNTG